jgi:hypothetical protein
MALKDATNAPPQLHSPPSRLPSRRVPNLRHLPLGHATKIPSTRAIPVSFPGNEAMLAKTASTRPSETRPETGHSIVGTYVGLICLPDFKNKV